MSHNPPEAEPGPTPLDIPKENTADQLAPERLGEPSVDRAAERIDAWYGQLEPRLGVHLTDPNVVLTLADARGQTEFYVTEIEPGDAEAFGRLNEQTQAEGIRFQTSEYVSRTTDQPALMVNVESLAGYQAASQATHLPGVPRFNSEAGWDGVEAWQNEALASIQAAADHGEYPPQIHEEDKTAHVLIGIMKGYPDEAILAMVTDRPLRDGEEPFARRTNVSHADFYDGAQPNYRYNIADEEVIVRHTNAWGKLLTDYYASDQHQRLAADPQFRAARGLGA